MKVRVGKLLTAIGGAIGLLGAIAMGVKLKMTVTPEMHEVLVYRELFVASAILLVLGAVFGRRERQERAEQEAESLRELGGPSELPLDSEFEVDKSKMRER